MEHYPVKNVLREMVQYGVMEIVYGAIISVWHEEQVINLTYLLICTLTKAEFATLNIKNVTNPFHLLSHTAAIKL